MSLWCCLPSIRTARGLTTFVNRGNNFLLDEGDSDLFVLKFKAKKAGKFTLKMKDGMLVDRNLGTTQLK